MRHAVNPIELRSLLDEPTAAAAQIQLNHDEVSMEYYSGHLFPALEMVPIDKRRLSIDTMAPGCRCVPLGSQFNWTLNQEIVFSAALTGKPKKKLFFSQHCWKRCVIGTKYDFAISCE